MCHRVIDCLLIPRLSRTVLAYRLTPPELRLVLYRFLFVSSMDLLVRHFLWHGPLFVLCSSDPCRTSFPSSPNRLLCLTASMGILGVNDRTSTRVRSFGCSISNSTPAQSAMSPESTSANFARRHGLTHCQHSLQRWSRCNSGTQKQPAVVENDSASSR